MISKNVAGTSVESTIKSYSRRKDGRAVFLVLISNHTGDTKYWAIVKYRSKLLHNIKRNGPNYPLEQHVSNHRTAIENLCDCTTHIVNTVPNIPQRVKFLLEFITSQDNSLHAVMVNIRANTNGLRCDFEVTSSHLIEVDPYQRSTKYNPKKPNPVKVLVITFSGRGKTGVYLCWNTSQEFRYLSSEKKDELTSHKGLNEGKASIEKHWTSNIKKRRRDPDNYEKGNRWKKLRKQLRRNQDHHTLCPSCLKRKQTNLP